MKAMVLRRLLLLLAAGVLVMAAALALGVFEQYGRAERAARLSGLLNIRQRLVRYAEARGRYPESLWEAVPRNDYRHELGQMPLHYLAGGKPYPLEGDARVLCDRAARRYGFQVGWFEFTEDDWRFHEGER